MFASLHFAFFNIITINNFRYKLQKITFFCKNSMHISSPYMG